MKKSVFFLALLALSFQGLSANTTKSASFYLNSPEKWEGKKITLYTAYVKRQAAMEKSGDILFSAYTMSRDNMDTSFIYVVVPKDRADFFASRYGPSMQYQAREIKKTPMTGILRQVNDTWFLEY
jgi:hypothetical protein